MIIILRKVKYSDKSLLSLAVHPNPGLSVVWAVF